VLTTLLGVIAVGLLLLGWRTTDVLVEEPNQDDLNGEAPTQSGEMAGWLRLLALAVIMVLTMFSLSRLGMVLTAVLLFLATAFLFKTRHPVVAVVCSIVFPMVLYLFFAHVAGVAIPQGNFIRLP